MIKRIVSGLLSFCMVLTLLPVTALATETTEVAYSVTGGNIYFDPATGAITDCDESVTEVQIPSEINEVAVTSIGNSAFSECRSLEKVTLPDSLTSIGASAFSECESLTSITLSANLESIGDSAFYRCIKLGNIMLPDSLTSLGSSAFSMCYNLTNIALPDGLTSISSYAFSNCDSLANVTLPDGLTSIGDHAFYACYGLKSITLPDSLTSIEHWAFNDCRNLTSINLPDGLTIIGDNAFSGCESLTGIILPDSLTSLGDDVFSGCSGLTSITLPDGLTSIGDDAFYNCDSLASITLPDSITSVGYMAFNGCSALEDVYYAGSETQWAQIEIGDSNDPLDTAIIHYNSTGPDGSGSDEGGNTDDDPAETDVAYPVVGGNIYFDPASGAITGCDEKVTAAQIPSEINGVAVTSIGAGAFSSCPSLTEITIPDSVTGIDKAAFFSCSGLVRLTMPATAEIGYDSFRSCNNISYVKLTGTGMMVEYDYQHTPWYWGGDNGDHDIEIDIEYGVTSISYRAFYCCDQLSRISIPNSVASIGSSAFYQCDGLTQVIIPDSITSIGNAAFYDCSNLENVVLSNQLESIGDSAFSGCEKLREIIIPGSVDNIGEGAFSMCFNLTEATISDGVLTIGASAFWSCTSLKEISIPDTVTSIGGSAFSDCLNATELYIGTGLSDVGEYAFSGCNSLETIVYNAKNASGISSNAFAHNGANDGVDVVFGAAVEIIPDNLFYRASSYGNDIVVNSVVMGENVTEIGANAFYGANLVEINIPEKVLSIGESAFYRCTQLTDVSIGKNVTNIGSNAFSSCSNLKNIYYSAISAQDVDLYDGQSGVFHDSGTNSVSVFVSNTTKAIPANIFAGLNIVSLNLGNSVEDIGEYAFSDCESLTSITLPDSLTSVGESAFSGCSGLENVTLSDNLTSIGNSAFSGCDRLTSIILPDSLISIGHGVFSDCSSLASITLPDGLTSIGNEVFYNCTNLESVTLSDNLISIGNSAFDDCSELKDVYYAGSEAQWEQISIGSYNDPLNTATIHYNSTGSDGTDPGGSDQAISSVQFFSSWNPDTKQAFFGNNSPAYSVAETVDTSAIGALVGKYVLVETDEANVFQITSLKPVESKIGTVLDVGENLISFETGVYLPTSSNLILSPYEGKTVLYHICENKIIAINILEERTGTFHGWDGTTEQATIDGTVYPINFLTDRSFLGSLEEYWGENVTYFVCGDEAYKPLIRIDGIVETEKGIAVFSTEKSLTVQTGEFMGLAFGKTVNGEIDGGWRQMAIVVSDPTVISLTEYEEEEYGYLLKVFGKKQGATNVTITDTESGASTSIVITVRDAYAETYSYEIDNMQTFYPNNNWEDHVQTNIYDLNGLYVNNYQCRKTGDTYTVSFDAYNQRYHTGAVDIYDADGNWIKSEEIAKMEMISSLWDTGEQVFYLISNSMDGKILTYQQAASSKYTRLSFEVPDGGYFTISNNYAESPGTFLFNSCDILFDGVCDLIDVGVDGTEKSSFMKLIMGEFEDNKALRESFIKAFKSTVEGQARTFAQQILEFELADASSNITQQLENLFKTLGLDWKNLFKFAANVGEGTILDKMGPAGLALKGCFEFSKGGSKLTQVFNIAGSVDAPYANVYSSIEEGYVNKHGVIVNTNGNMDAEAVLQVFRISNDHTIEVILDGSGGDRPKDYVLYNICFVKDDQLVQPSGKVSVRIPIPEWMDSDTCDVYRQEKDGNWTPLTAQIEGNYLVFETDHFSLYGVVGELSKLKISSFPNQTQYSVGDIFNPDGLVLSLNGDLIDTGFICDSMVLSEPGTQKITVQYGIASTEFTIFVQANTSGDGSDEPILGVYTITFNANLGNWGDNITSKEVKTGTDSKLAAAPENPTRNGYIFDGWFSAATGGEEVSNLSAYVFTEDTTLYAQWIRRSSSSSVGQSSSSSYTVTVANTDNGSIRVNPTRAEEGDTVTITATPGPGYEVGEIIVTDRNGREIAVRNIGNNRYTFKMPSGQVKVDATFVRIEGTAPQIIFQDVIAGTYYYDAVLWAVEQGITSGVTATTFNPNGSCTRAQIVTFLWRANGSPVPQTGVNPFTDVSPDAYYYDAVLWAVEEGITSGTTATSFSPNSGCTRAQAATFLWRSEGSPADTSSSSFTDVADNAYYADAVKWAVANGVTLGTTASTFSPYSGCTRAQIVTFLYRAMA